MLAKLENYRVKSNQLAVQLGRQNPKYQLQENQQKLSALVKQLAKGISHKQERLQLKLAQSMHLLDTVSPLKTLGRGYAVIRDQQDTVISSVETVANGDCLKGQLIDGVIFLEVQDTQIKRLK
jgi:exodeoxyribonuclease VII large subunit